MTATERALTREINTAAARLALARKMANRTGESDVRLLYCEAWLASLMSVARSLP